jgi:hypothetical protein
VNQLLSAVHTPDVVESVLAVAGPSNVPRAAHCFAMLAREVGGNPPPPLRADPTTPGSIENEARSSVEEPGYWAQAPLESVG